AVSWYRKSADQGNAKGQYNLADMYEYGKGVTKDLAQALSWYQKSAAQGDDKAQAALKRLDVPSQLRTSPANPSQRDFASDLRSVVDLVRAGKQDELKTFKLTDATA